MKVRRVKPALFDVPVVVRGQRRTTAEAIEVDPRRDVCPVCEARLTIVISIQPALFFMHGFGGMVRAATWWCGRCGFHRHHTTTTLSPREPIESAPR